MRDLRLIWRGILAELRIFRRTAIAAFFTLAMPLGMLVLFVALFGNDEIGEFEYGPVTTAQFYAAGLAVFAAASATYTNVAVNLSLKREQGILKRLRGTPIPPWVFMAGVILAAMIVALLASSLMVGVGMAAYGINLQASMAPAMLLSFLSGVLCFAALGVALASLTSTGNSAVATANATILPMAFYFERVRGAGRPTDMAQPCRRHPPTQAVRRGIRQGDVPVQRRPRFRLGPPRRATCLDRGGSGRGPGPVPLGKDAGLAAATLQGG